MHTWSETNLGQWHYVLGYLIVLISHNWPIMLALVGCAWFGYKAYRTPNRLWVSWLLTALTFGLAYEYHKHIASEFENAIMFLFHLGLEKLQKPLIWFFGPVMRTTLTLCCLGCIVKAIQITLRRTAQ